MIFGLQEAGGFLAELVEAEVVDGHAEDGEFTGQESGLLQVVKRGDELAHGEIAGGAEDDHGARAGRFARLFEFVVEFGDRRQRHFQQNPQWALTVKRAEEGVKRGGE